MPDKKPKEPTKPVPPGAPMRELTVFEQLEALRSPLAKATKEGTHNDVVRIALTTVIGAIDHVRDARHQADPLWRRH